MSKSNRTIAVLGNLDAGSLAAAREAADAVSASVVAHLGAPRDLLTGEAPTALLVPMQGAAAFDACAEIRAEVRFADVPLIGIGSQRDSLAFAEIFNSGGDDLVSARSAAAIARRLRAVCSRGESSALRRTDTHAVVAGPSAKWQTIVARALSNAGIVTRFVSDASEAIIASQGAKFVVAADDLGPHGAQQAIVEARRFGAEAPWVIVAPPKRMAEVAASVSMLSRVAVVDAFAPPENALFVANELAGASMSDGRATQRLLFGTTATFRVAGREEDDVGFTYNVSAGGVYIRTLAPLDPGEKVWLELCAPRSSRRVRLVGTVAWRRHFGPNESATVPAGFGIQITGGLAGDLERWQNGCELLAIAEQRILPRSTTVHPRATVVPSFIARATVEA